MLHSYYYTSRLLLLDLTTGKGTYLMGTIDRILCAHTVLIGLAQDGMVVQVGQREDHTGTQIRRCCGCCRTTSRASCCSSCIENATKFLEQRRRRRRRCDDVFGTTTAIICSRHIQERVVFFVGFFLQDLFVPLTSYLTEYSYRRIIHSSSRTAIRRSIVFVRRRRCSSSSSTWMEETFERRWVRRLHDGACVSVCVCDVFAWMVTDQPWLGMCRRLVALSCDQARSTDRPIELEARYSL